MVSQRGPEDREPHWALPGGRIEEGELPNEALVREVREETGLEVLDPGVLAFVMHVDELGGVQTIVYCFEVANWRGTIACADPDGLVLEARFFSVSEALRAVEAIPWLKTTQPTVSYLRDDAPCGALWLYRVPRNGSAVLVARAPARAPQ